MLRHQKFHVEKVFPCEHCHEVLDKRWQYDKHLEQVHGRRQRNACPECAAVFYQPTELMAHLQACHQEKKAFKCQVCQLDFGLKQQLMKHLSTWHSTMPISVCPVCIEIFEDKAALDSHACPGAEVTNRNIICHQHESPVRLTGRQQLEEHMLTQHRTSLGGASTNTKFQVSCCICQKTFLLKKNLWKHLRNIHNLETAGTATGQQKTAPAVVKRTNHSCTVCGRTFYYKNDLANHMEQRHASVKAYRCADTSCGRAFTSLKSLKQHARNSECSSGTPNKDDLTCPVCGKRLSTKAKLKTHQRLTHSEVRAFPCRYCELRFKEKRMLRQHVNNRHKEQVLLATATAKASATAGVGECVQADDNNKSTILTALPVTSTTACVTTATTVSESCSSQMDSSSIPTTPQTNTHSSTSEQVHLPLPTVTQSDKNDDGCDIRLWRGDGLSADSTD